MLELIVFGIAFFASFLVHSICLFASLRATVNQTYRFNPVSRAMWRDPKPIRTRSMV